MVELQDDQGTVSGTQKVGGRARSAEFLFHTNCNP